MNWDILLVDLVELGFGDVLSLAQTVGIICTMVLTLYFSKRQIQGLSIAMEHRSIQKVMDNEGKPLRERLLYGI